MQCPQCKVGRLRRKVHIFADVPVGYHNLSKRGIRSREVQIGGVDWDRGIIYCPECDFILDQRPKPKWSRGVDLIALERERQIHEEGWTAEHDAMCNSDGQLAQAAAVYAAGKLLFAFETRDLPAYQADGKGGTIETLAPVMGYHQIWPWDAEWYKPKDRIRDLVRAGALIAAELDRLLAQESKTELEE